MPVEKTQELMENFYRRILKEQPGADTLREAQPDIETKYPEPHFGRLIDQGDPNLVA